MTTSQIVIHRSGLVTAVGLSAPESCAAFRAKITNPVETRFIESGGAWIVAHEVQLAQNWRGVTKLAKMAAMAIDEALQCVAPAEWHTLPLLLCVAESDRPGRSPGLDDQLFLKIEDELDLRFDAQSAVIAEGRVGVAVALARARALLQQGKSSHVLVAATDSLLSWPTLSHYDRLDRVLTARNSNGFMPGEGAGALLVGLPEARAGELVCSGIGFGHEPAPLDSEEPLRADGLTQAIKASLAESGLQMHDFDYRITDLAGEHYYFKEAALALSRTLRQRKAEFDMWHPAECTGEAGAASGVILIAQAQAACDRGYSKGSNVLVHWANDGGQRAAVTLQHRRAL
jgi:3-oxoacyl-[acyl-carrier-protein] synthase-1